MGQVIQVNGDYKIKTNPSGSITLDTGLSVGTVRITGNLIVEGTTTTITTDNVVISDNILVLNEGETGAGVSIGHAGILINRGTLNPSGIIFDEATDSWQFAHGYDDSSTVFSLANSKITVRNILTNGSDLTLVSDGTGLVKVGNPTYETGVLNYPLSESIFEIAFMESVGSTIIITTVIPHGLVVGNVIDVYSSNISEVNGLDYVITEVTTYSVSYILNVINFSHRGAAGYIRAVQRQLRGTNIIPNMKTVSDYTRSAIDTAVTHLAGSIRQINDSDTSVVTSDLSTSSQASFIELSVDSTLQLRVTNGLLRFAESAVFDKGISGPSNEIEVTDTLSIQHRVTNPISEANTTKLYSKSAVGSGGTGLYFTNSSGTTDEVVSRTKTLMYSLIF